MRWFLHPSVCLKWMWKEHLGICYGHWIEYGYWKIKNSLNDKTVRFLLLKIARMSGSVVKLDCACHRCVCCNLGMKKVSREYRCEWVVVVSPCRLCYHTKWHNKRIYYVIGRGILEMDEKVTEGKGNQQELGKSTKLMVTGYCIQSSCCTAFTCPINIDEVTVVSALSKATVGTSFCPQHQSRGDCGSHLQPFCCMQLSLFPFV